MAYWKFAFVAAVCWTSAASAATVTKTYVTTSTYVGAPVGTVTQTYSLTFDPFAEVVNATLNSYSVDTSLTAFNVPALFNVRQTALPPHQITIGGTPNGAGSVSAGTNDFLSFFAIDDQGEPVTGLTTSSVSSNGSIYLAASSITRSMAAAVPEPVTWAMLINGFGLIGARMRRRPHLTRQIAYR